MKRCSRPLLVTLLSILSAFSAITYISCNRDSCDGTVCANGGSCSAGVCYCADGYEGLRCSEAMRAKFTGTWTQAGTPSITSASSFPVSVEAADGIRNIVVINLNNTIRQPVHGQVISSDSLIIPSQGVPVAGVTVSGYAIYDPAAGTPTTYNNISVHYDIVDSASGHVTSVDTRW